MRMNSFPFSCNSGAGNYLSLFISSVWARIQFRRVARKVLINFITLCNTWEEDGTRKLNYRIRRCIRLPRPFLPFSSIDIMERCRQILLTTWWVILMMDGRRKVVRRRAKVFAMGESELEIHSIIRQVIDIVNWLYRLSKAIKSRILLMARRDVVLLHHNRRGVPTSTTWSSSWRRKVGLGRYIANSCESGMTSGTASTINQIFISLFNDWYLVF